MTDLAAADFGVFLSDFGSEITPLTWGVPAFRGIVDRVEVEMAGAGGTSVSRYRTTVLTAAANVPATAAQGDQVQVAGTTYKVLDFVEGEPGAITLILGRVS
jgi:hypothetical protein